jgi:hypothetical protein
MFNHIMDPGYAQTPIKQYVPFSPVPFHPLSLSSAFLSLSLLPVVWGTGGSRGNALPPLPSGQGYGRVTIPDTKLGNLNGICPIWCILVYFKTIVTVATATKNKLTR